MTETAKQVAEAAEHRFDGLAEEVRRRFDEITKGRFSDQVASGRVGSRNAGPARTARHRRERGGPS